MSEAVAFFADSLLDPATGESAGPATVLIEDGRVVRLGLSADVTVPAQARRVDAGGLTLMPGLIDCHVHLLAEGVGVDLDEALGTPPSLALLKSVPSAARTLNAGFTTVRDAGGTPAGAKMAIDRGLFPGPRMLTAVTFLGQTGGHSDLHFPCGVSLRQESEEVPAYVVDGVEAMRLRVRQLIRAGADWIKLCTSGGVMSPGDSPRHAHFTLEEIRTAVEEAATQGRNVMAHAQATAGIKNALVGGVATIEHGIWLDDDAIEMMLDGQRSLVPTLVAPLWVIRHAEAGRMPAWGEAKGRMVFEDHKASIRRAIEAGVTIAFGTDSGVGPHGTNGEEFLLLSELGMSPLDCVRAATTIAARVIGMAGVGMLTQGTHGDLIGVPGDPVSDLKLLAEADHVRLVVKGGTIIKDSDRRVA